MEVVLLVGQIAPGEPSNIPLLFAVEVSHASPQSVCAKDDALANMMFMLVTLDTSHLERSPLNLSDPRTGVDFVLKNNQLISVIAEISQDPIGPCRPLEQSVGDSWRHFFMMA